MSTIKNTMPLLSSWVLATAVLCGPALASPRPQQPGAHQHGEQKKETTLEEQVVELRAKVARLEAALQMNHQGQSTKPAASGQPQSSHAQTATRPATGGQMGGMGMMKGMGKSGGMGKMQGMGGMGKMKSGGMGAMQGMGQSDSAMTMGMDMGRMKRMRMMGKMTRGEQPQPAAVMSSLPGFPGASHIYHIGAAGHFLDHADAVGLSQEQRKQLAVVHQKSQLRQNDFERKIEQAEQELWVLTSAGEPDANAIATKVREIATIQAQMRLAFIKSVGDAAKVLTEPQRRALVGEHQEGAHQDTKK